MQFCNVCSSESMFKCGCSSPPSYFCKYHNVDHLLHSDFRFIFTKSLKSNLKKTLEFFEGQKDKVKNCFHQLNESKSKFVTFVKEVYAESRLKLSKVHQDLENSIKLLKEFQVLKEYEYFTVAKYLIDPDLQLNNSLVRWKDTTSQIMRKFSNHLKVEAITESLLKHHEKLMFDNDFFEIEIEKANIRDKAIRTCEGLSNINDSKSTFIHNMNKRQYNCFKYKKYDTPSHFDVYIMKSLYSKKTNLFSLINIDLSFDIFQRIMKSLYHLEQVGSLIIENSIKSQEEYNLLISALQNKKVIKHIKLKGNHILGENLSKLFCSFDSYQERIESLILKFNSFTSQGCGILDIHLPNFKNLRELDISYNYINDEGVELIQESLSSLQSLEDLNISGNYLNPVGIKFLMNAITYLPHLSVLNVSDNQGLDEGALVISGYLKKMKMLMVLCIDYLIQPETEDILCFQSYPYTKIIARNERNEVRTIKPPYFDRDIVDMLN